MKRQSKPSEKKRAKSHSVPSLPQIAKPPPSLVGSGSERSSTPSGSGSAHSPKSTPTSQTLYVPHGEVGDLYNDFDPEFDAATIGFCFQCADACETRALTRTVERVGFRFQQGIDIYRPLYSCADCLHRLLARKRLDPRHCVRIVEQALSLYARQSL